MQSATEISRQLVNTLCQHLGYSNSRHNISVSDLNMLILGQLLKAPLYIYVGMMFLVHLFNWFPLLTWGKTFCALPIDRQIAYTLNWKVSRIGTKREFINFYQSFIILGLYEKFDSADYIKNLSGTVVKQ